MGNITSCLGTTRTSSPASDGVTVISMTRLLDRNALHLCSGVRSGMRNSARITDLPPEMLLEIGRHLDARSYTRFRASCQRVRSALPSPREINAKIRHNENIHADFHRIAAQGKLRVHMKACSASIRFSLKHSLNKWLNSFAARPDHLGFGFLFGNYSFAMRTKDHDVVETVLNQFVGSHGETQPPSAWAYSFQEGYGHGLGYAIHVLFIDGAAITPTALADTLARANRIFAEGTSTEKLVTLSFLAQFLSGLKQLPEKIWLVDTYLERMFAEYPALMHSTWALDEWRAQQQPECRYMYVVSGQAASEDSD